MRTAQPSGHSLPWPSSNSVIFASESSAERAVARMRSKALAKGAARARRAWPRRSPRCGHGPMRLRSAAGRRIRDAGSTAMLSRGTVVSERRLLMAVRRHHAEILGDEGDFRQHVHRTRASIRQNGLSRACTSASTSRRASSGAWRAVLPRWTRGGGRGRSDGRLRTAEPRSAWIRPGVHSLWSGKPFRGSCFGYSRTQGPCWGG
jgi:hypothetical protein